jgi:hypothetical protein
MRLAYAKWRKLGLMKPLPDAATTRVVADIVLVTASSFFQFYESAERPATRKPLLSANNYLATFLRPYL